MEASPEEMPVGTMKEASDVPQRSVLARRIVLATTALGFY
jgi:hypothetical protein